LETNFEEIFLIRDLIAFEIIPMLPLISMKILYLGDTLFLLSSLATFLFNVFFFFYASLLHRIYLHFFYASLLHRICLHFFYASLLHRICLPRASFFVRRMRRNPSSLWAQRSTSLLQMKGKGSVCLWGIPGPLCSPHGIWNGKWSYFIGLQVSIENLANSYFRNSCSVVILSLKMRNLR